MSNHSRLSGLDTPPDTADDLDEPPPFRQTHCTSGSREQGRHGFSTFTRPLPQRPIPSRRRFINQQEGSRSAGISVFNHLSPVTAVSPEESNPAVTAPTTPYSASRPPLFPHPSYTRVPPHLAQTHQQSNPEEHYRSLQDQRNLAVFHEPQQHYHIPENRQAQQDFSQQLHHHRHLFPHPSPASSLQSISLASSSSDTSSLLCHPHDPRLLQAQLQAPTENGFVGFAYADPDLTPNPGDLVPIQFPGPESAILDPERPMGFPLSGLAGPTYLFHHDDSDDFLQHRHTGVLQYPGGFPAPYMHNPGLSILNAESFDDYMSGFRAPRSLPPGKSVVETSDEPKRSSKKRSKAQSTEGAELDDEERKRSRGRPRLDTNDETAKDRAYRNRKETAIQSLEKKVDELRRTNEEMSKEFMKLYDFAVSKGMHESTPEFGRQLQATTEKFVSLARKMSEEPEKEGDVLPSQENDGEVDEVGGPSSGQEKSNEKSPSAESLSADIAKPTDHVIYDVLSSEDQQPLLQLTPRTLAMTAVHTASWAPDSQSHMPHSTLSQAPLGYEIVTEPTPDNASFPFGMSYEHSLEQPGAFDLLANQPFSESLFNVLSSPTSYAYQERTFGRRLQRSTLEKAYTLLRMPNPPSSLLSSAFGFSLLFEPKEKIIERIANCLSVNQRETLFNWKVPFLHLGGGGTWFDEMNGLDEMAYPSGHKQRDPVGNQGTAEPYRQKVDSLFGMGPWDPQTEEVRDLRVERAAARLRMNVPGLQGEFYDADEVEWVLRKRGVDIPAAADFVTAEIDPADFSDETAVAGRALSSGMENNSDNMNTAADILGSLNSYGTSPGDAAARQWLGQTLKPTRPSDVHLGDTRSVAQSSEETSSQMALDPNLVGDMFGLETTPANQTSNIPGSKKRAVTINVGVLVQGTFLSFLKAALLRLDD
ncbi:BZIP family transcription factor [Colletotrichum orchidophilum]|uniref:BZIP family transcription factor n=1 Tax=Colletotrichum orchidophilum TaxID=1209926 RepID=A0A1G4AQP6_9PEZI|nr:BZIP family transcription factor [Colletotrichum orchidophilum]OHE91342.1 BZIP family transcription factor [Colletotrichum orchidophilum]